MYVDDRLSMLVSVSGDTRDAQLEHHYAAIFHSWELLNPVQPIDSRAVLLIIVLICTIVGSLESFSMLTSPIAPSSQAVIARYSRVPGGKRLKISCSVGVLGVHH